ncbi:MAG: YigZ family protein [Synergistaceae bacterium]|nr:YigZ family protein [Synergistaceae bacterium]
MEEIFFIPAKAVSYEEKIKRSIFIAELEPCNNEKEARDFLARVIAKHRDATHNCRAYIINGVEYSSDDGEPSGTAGKPILNTIKHSELVNVMVIVTRYFGGVKLGVRGLIDAYGGVAAKALELAGRIEKIKTFSINISLEYNSMGAITKLLETYNAINFSWEYGKNVNVKADVPENFFENLTRELEQLKARKIIKSFVTS